MFSGQGYTTISLRCAAYCEPEVNLRGIPYLRLLWCNCITPHVRTFLMPAHLTNVDTDYVVFGCFVFLCYAVVIVIIIIVAVVETWHLGPLDRGWW